MPRRPKSKMCYWWVALHMFPSSEKCFESCSARRASFELLFWSVTLPDKLHRVVPWAKFSGNAAMGYCNHQHIRIFLSRWGQFNCSFQSMVSSYQRASHIVISELNLQKQVPPGSKHGTNTCRFSQSFSRSLVRHRMQNILSYKVQLTRPRCVVHAWRAMGPCFIELFDSCLFEEPHRLLDVSRPVWSGI